VRQGQQKGKRLPICICTCINS